MEEQGLPIEHGQVMQAAETLKCYIEKLEDANKSKKKNLLQESSNSTIFLQISLKKIPTLSSIQMIKVPLPHSLLTDTSEICLITGDLDKRDWKADIEPTVQHYKELLASHGVTCVTEIIPLRQLRTEYKMHEAKRQLYGAYELFLADEKIGGSLPKALGKFFFKKRKFPQQINLRTSNLKKQFEKATSQAVFFVTGRGAACKAEVAHFGLPMKQVVENIEAAINTLKLKIPGEWQNIRGLYIKTATSVSIPLYISLESANDVNLPVMKSVDDVEAEEITTLRRSKVKVYPDGNVELVPNLENSSEDESDSEAILLKEQDFLKARKIRKQRIMQIPITKKTVKNKTSLNSEAKASSNVSPKGIEESLKKKSSIDVHMKGLKKRTMKERKISVDFSIQESKDPPKKKKKIGVDFSTEESKDPPKKKRKIAVDFSTEESKHPPKKKIAVDFSTEELKDPAKKKIAVDVNIKKIKQSTVSRKETGSNINIKGVKEPAAKKMEATERLQKPSKKKKQILML